MANSHINSNNIMDEPIPVDNNLSQPLQLTMFEKIKNKVSSLLDLATRKSKEYLKGLVEAFIKPTEFNMNKKDEKIEQWKGKVIHLYNKKT